MKKNMNKNQRTAFFSLISLFGLPIIFVPLLVFLIKTNFSLAIRAAAILVLTEIVCASIKFIYRKERPAPVLSAKTLFQIYNARSFPSIHTARITAFSVILAYLYGNKLLGVVSALLIIAVSYSRIHLKKHDAIDVVGGFVIGTIISAVGLLI